jgi:hypothetical protein
MRPTIDQRRYAAEWNLQAVRALQEPVTAGRA